jgi:hypothetical protein
MKHFALVLLTASFAIAGCGSLASATQRATACPVEPNLYDVHRGPSGKEWSASCEGAQYDCNKSAGAEVTCSPKSEPTPPHRRARRTEPTDRAPQEDN